MACDICGETLSGGHLENCQFLGSNSCKPLDEQLRAYFIVNRLLDFSKEDTLSMISHGMESTLRICDPLLRTCSKCDQFIDEAVKLNQKLAALQTQISALGKDLRRRFGAQPAEYQERSLMYLTLRGVLIKEERLENPISIESDMEQEQMHSFESMEYGQIAVENKYTDNFLEEKPKVMRKRSKKVFKKPKKKGKILCVSSADSNFHCELCESVYTTVPGIKKHNRMHEESKRMGNIYDCRICRHPNLSESKLRRHMTRIHGHLKVKKQRKSKIRVSSAGRNFQCELCESVYTTLPGIKKHNRMHEESKRIDNIYDCRICRHPNLSKSKLRRHMTKFHAHLKVKKPRKSQIRVSSTGRSFHCELCKSVYTTIPGFTKHNRMHEESKRMGNIYDCRICRHPNLSESKLRRHMTKIHDPSKLESEEIKDDVPATTLLQSEDKTTDNGKTSMTTCSICQKQLNIAQLDWHMRRHKEFDDSRDSTTGLFRCKLCSYVGLSIRALISHKYSFHRNATDSALTHLCAECGKSYYTPFGLRRHVKTIHENRYSFTCDQCGKGFETKQDFQNHKMTHDRVRSKQHVCDICGIAYSHKRSLKHHITRIHSSEAKNIPGVLRDEKRYPVEKEHKCKWCDMVFPYKYLLVDHIPSAHQDLYTFCCGKCDKKYISASSLRLHQDISHSGQKKSFKCEYCQRVFVHRHYGLNHYKFCSAKRNADKLKSKVT